ncbi:hypothetical protein F5Y16DRAFT_412494 [Xylariaceae sp. FL0255]|nr:hypothetical protein F5Y16DRAFT_412494 [Xylariaceae sp. FL0255]
MSHNSIQAGGQDEFLPVYIGTGTDYNAHYQSQDYHTIFSKIIQPVSPEQDRIADVEKRSDHLHGPASHQRGWSESTTWFDPSDQIPKLIERSNLNHIYLRNIAQSWAREIITIVVAFGALGGILGVLARFNGRALPEWPYYITLNALVALLATVTTANLAVVLQGGISQLKWIRVTESPAPLSDIEAFDQASPGTLGALRLLISGRGGSKGAVIPRALNFTAALPGTTSSTGYVPILPLKSAVYNGLFAENGRPGADLAFQCQTGNCTWDHYDTLGVCSSCVDLTPFIQPYCNSDSNAINCGWQVPQGAKLNNSADVFSMTSIIPSMRGDQPESSIVRLIFMGTEAFNGTAGSTEPWARQCTMSACLQTLESKVSNGALTETVTSSTINWISYQLDFEAMLSMRGWFSTVVANGSASRSTAAYNRTITDNSIVVNLTVGISSGETFFDSDIVTAFYWSYYEYPNGMDLLVNDTATSMTVAFRSLGGAVSVTGDAYVSESYVHVRWGFAAVPICVVTATALFLALSIYNALALLFHGLDDQSREFFNTKENVRGQKQQAQCATVQLAESENVGFHLELIKT